LSRRDISRRVLHLGPISAAGLAVAALLLTPACRKSEAEGATFGLEQTLRDTKASLAAIGLPSSPENQQLAPACAIAAAPHQRH